MKNSAGSLRQNSVITRKTFRAIRPLFWDVAHVDFANPSHDWRVPVFGRLPDLAVVPIYCVGTVHHFGPLHMSAMSSTQFVVLRGPHFEALHL